MNLYNKKTDILSCLCKEDLRKCRITWKELQYMRFDANGKRVLMLEESA